MIFRDSIEGKWNYNMTYINGYFDPHYVWKKNIVNKPKRKKNAHDEKFKFYINSIETTSYVLSQQQV